MCSLQNNNPVIANPVVVNEFGYTEPDIQGKVYYYPSNSGVGGLVDIKKVIYTENTLPSITTPDKQ